MEETVTGLTPSPLLIPLPYCRFPDLANTRVSGHDSQKVAVGLAVEGGGWGCVDVCVWGGGKGRGEVGQSGLSN